MRCIGGERPWDGGPSGDRGQSNIIGIVLIMGLTVMVVSSLLIFGSAALTSSQRDSQVGSAEHAMTQLDSRISLAALGESENQVSSFPIQSTGDQLTVSDTGGWMNVSIVDPDDGSVDVVMNESLGEIVYENEGTVIAYQGGGVWKKTDGYSTLVSPPEFHYRPGDGEDATLTLPLVSIESSGTLTGDVAIESTSVDARYPDPSNSARLNPLTGGRVEITVQSDYYQGWGQYFETRTGGDVTYDHAAETVSITLAIPQNQPSPQWAIAGTGSGTLEIWEWFGDYPEVDAYDSDVGAYPSGSSNATIAVSGALEVGSTPDLLGGGPQLDTDFIVGDYVNIYDENAVIDGNVSAGTWIECDPPSPPEDCPQITGTTDTTASVPSVSPIGSRVRQEVGDIQANNDNSDTSAIANNDRWANGADPLVLTNGTYYVESKRNDLNGRTLQLDTTSGNITIAMEGPIDWKDVTVEIQGPEENFVRIFYAGDSIELDESTVGDVTDTDSTKLRIYGVEGIDVAMQDGTTFVGMIYAPGSASSGGSVRIGPEGYGGWGSNPDGTEVFGAIVGSSEIKFGSDTKFHYDESLRTLSPYFSASDAPKVTYLHVTVNEVNVTSR